MRKGVLLPGSAARVVITLLLLGAAGCGPRPTSEDNSPIDVSQPPDQTAVDNADPIRLEAGGYEFVITPLAHYVLRGIVVSREGYRTGWNAELAPCDVAMVWGELAADGSWRKLAWSQSSRWYFWKWHGQQPFTNEEVVRTSSNTHVVPASSNVARAARSLAPGDIAELAGDLVRIDGRKGQEKVWWKSSLSRTDTGDSSCELLYLRRLRVNGKVYE
jgi:hypothetical protein